MPKRKTTKRLNDAIRGLLAELDRNNYREFWGQVKDVQILFKNLKPTLREERERLWSEFGALCERAKHEQERQREKRANISRIKRDLVDSKLNEAYHQARGSRSESELRVADELAEKAKEWMRDGYAHGFTGTTEFFESVLGNDGIMTKADADACWTRFKEVKETIKWRRKEFGDFNYGQFLRDANHARSLAEHSPKEAREKVKETQQAMKGRTMEAWQFDQVRSALDEAFKAANDSSQRKQDAWKDNMRSAKSRKYELLEKNRSVIASIETQIDRCRDMLSEARSWEHQQRVQGWIDEKLAKIRDIERFTHELEDQISDIDSRLNR